MLRASVMDDVEGGHVESNNSTHIGTRIATKSGSNKSSNNNIKHIHINNSNDSSLSQARTIVPVSGMASTNNAPISGMQSTINAPISETGTVWIFKYWHTIPRRRIAEIELYWTSGIDFVALGARSGVHGTWWNEDTAAGRCPYFFVI